MVITDISRCLKRTNKQVKIRLRVFIFTKQHAYTLKEFLQFLPRFSIRNPMNSLSFSQIYFHFFSIINGVTLLWTTTVLSDKLDISLRPSKSTGQTQLDVLRDVIRQIFPLFISPVSQVLRIETKISQYNELESKVSQMDGRTFHFNENFIF